MKKNNYFLIVLLINSFVFGIAYSSLITSNITLKNSNDLESGLTPLENPKTSVNKDWTFMVYLDADCNLEGPGINDINEMEMVGSDSNINIVVQIDRIPGYDSSNGDWTGAKRYYVTKDYSGSIISSTAVQDLGEVNMGSSSTLSNFISWSKSNYPADKYALILWDHGSGVMVGSSIGGVCWDDSNSHDYLTLSEVKSSIQSNPVDLVGFDACLMGATEIHYQLKDVVDVVVGSEDNEPGDGYPYDDILYWLVTNPSATSAQLAQQIVLKYDSSYSSSYEITQAAADAFDNGFVTTLNNFIDNINSMAGTQGTNIGNARSATQAFNNPSYLDLWDFADEVQTQVPGMAALASSLKTAITNIVIEEEHSSHFPGAHGLSIYFPSSQSGYSTQYETTDFASNTNWDEFLKNYYTGTDGSGGGVNIDDEYEENDVNSEARLLTPGDYNLVCNGSDLDYFNITVAMGNVIDIEITFTHSAGDLDLYLYNNTGGLVNESETVSDKESVSYNATYNGNYTIVIDQYGTVMPYQSYTMSIDFGIDDGFEENDDWLNPQVIVANTTYSNLICRDSDQYYFTAVKGKLINITIWFDYAAGDLDLYFWDYDNEVILDLSVTAGDTENLLIAADGEDSNFYQFEVYNYEDNYDYSMRVEVSPVDDGYEDNDVSSESPLIGYGDYMNLVCMDWDLFNVSLTAGDWINITIYFDNEAGNLELYLLHANFSVVGMSMSFSDNEFIFYHVEISADYMIWVFFDDNLNLNYSLSIHTTTSVWDDTLEQNDWFDNSTELTIGLSYTNLSAIDWDCYKIYALINYRITITLEYNYSIGNLDLYLVYFDPAYPNVAYILDVSASITDEETITFDTTGTGYYYFLVYLDDLNMGYNLTVTEVDLSEDPSTPPADIPGISGFPFITLMVVLGLSIVILIGKKRKSIE